MALVLFSLLSIQSFAFDELTSQQILVSCVESNMYPQCLGIAEATSDENTFSIMQYCDKFTKNGAYKLAPNEDLLRPCLKSALRFLSTYSNADARNTVYKAGLSETVCSDLATKVYSSSNIDADVCYENALEILSITNYSRSAKETLQSIRETGRYKTKTEQLIEQRLARALRRPPARQ